jgi:hypothetical protein
MKKLHFRVAIALVALIAVFIVTGSTGKVHADPSSHGDVSGFCRDNADFGTSHGECVSIGEAHVNALADRGVTDGVAICKILEQVFGPFPLGQCVMRFAEH